MKLPYRVGDSFALPVGDGSAVDATIVARNHHTVDIAVSGLTLRVSDAALVLHRWRKTADRAKPERHGFSAAESGQGDDRWGISPAHAERIVATHLGIANVELPPLRVHNRWRPDFPPDSRYVRIAERGRIFDPRELTRYPHLEALELSGVALASPDFPRTLRALRLAWIATPVDLRDLAALPLHTLSLEELRHVRSLDALTQMPQLQQLEMLGFWHAKLDDVVPLLRLPKLVRAEVDVGGRRKNVELYKRANWAYPWPFDVVAAQCS